MQDYVTPICTVLKQASNIPVLVLCSHGTRSAMGRNGREFTDVPTLLEDLLGCRALFEQSRVLLMVSHM